MKNFRQIATSLRRHEYEFVIISGDYTNYDLYLDDVRKKFSVETWIPKSLFRYIKSSLPNLRKLLTVNWIISYREVLNSKFIISNDLDRIVSILRTCRQVKIIHIHSLFGCCHEKLQNNLYREQLGNMLGTYFQDKINELLGSNHYLKNSLREWRMIHRVSVLHPNIDDIFNIDVMVNINYFIPSANSASLVFVVFEDYTHDSNLTIIIEAYIKLLNLLDNDIRSNTFLVIAGNLNYESSVQVNYLIELEEQANRAPRNSIKFLMSVTNIVRKSLIYYSIACLFPRYRNNITNKHIFDCVHSSKVVIATNSYLTRELIQHNITGYLPEINSQSFLKYMCKVIMKPIFNKYIAKNAKYRITKLINYEWKKEKEKVDNTQIGIKESEVRDLIAILDKNYEKTIRDTYQNFAIPSTTNETHQDLMDEDTSHQQLHLEILANELEERYRIAPRDLLSCGDIIKDEPETSETQVTYTALNYNQKQMDEDDGINDSLQLFTPYDFNTRSLTTIFEEDEEEEEEEMDFKSQFDDDDDSSSTTICDTVREYNASSLKLKNEILSPERETFDFKSQFDDDDDSSSTTICDTVREYNASSLKLKNEILSPERETFDFKSQFDDDDDSSSTTSCDTVREYNASSLKLKNEILSPERETFDFKSQFDDADDSSSTSCDTVRENNASSLKLKNEILSPERETFDFKSQFDDDDDCSSTTSCDTVREYNASSLKLKNEILSPERETFDLSFDKKKFRNVCCSRRDTPYHSGFVNTRDFCSNFDNRTMQDVNYDSDVSDVSDVSYFIPLHTPRQLKLFPERNLDSDYCMSTSSTPREFDDLEYFETLYENDEPNDESEMESLPGLNTDRSYIDTDRSFIDTDRSFDESVPGTPITSTRAKMSHPNSKFDSKTERRRPVSEGSARPSIHQSTSRMNTNARDSTKIKQTKSVMKIKKSYS